MDFIARRAFARIVVRRLVGFAAASVLAVPTLVHASAVTLFSETFDNIDFGDDKSSDTRVFGVPTTTGASDGNDATIGNSDRDWYAARIELHDNGAPFQDVGVQKFGGDGNSTPVGIAEDDAGLLAHISTLGYTNIVLKFDWRTFSAGSGDEIVVGYFVGDLHGGIPNPSLSLAGLVAPSLVSGAPFDMATRSFDLRTAAEGGVDGNWNWGVGWIELLREKASDSFTTEMFKLTGAENQPDVWLAFWLDNGEGDFLKIDNVRVKGLVVPLPAPLLLLLSGLAGIALLRRRPVL